MDNEVSEGYEVIVHRKVASFLRKLPKENAKHVLRALEELREDPFRGDVKAIKSYINLFRRRIGKIRIIYYVDF